MEKAAVSEIAARFDGDVARFSNLESGQTSVPDARLALELGADVLRRLCPNARSLADLGCGAGNWTLMALDRLPALACTLIDISGEMLKTAEARVLKLTSSVVTIQKDFRYVELGESAFDIVTAGATLHHLRAEDEWEAVFAKVFRALRPGGCFLVSDLVSQELDVLSKLFNERWQTYLETAGGSAFSREIITLSEQEDTPRSFNFQFDLLKKCGFKTIEVLHKTACFATFCAVKAH